MDLGFKGKLAVVSGSTAGIGFAIARTLAREGARIVINGRTEKRVSAAEDSIRMEMRGAEVQGVAADLGTAKGVEEFVKQVPAADILVNNLGIFEIKPFLEISDEDWLRFYEVNVMSGVRLTRHYLPEMLRKNWGA
jgi:NAD(P)-dependent dehydrogenase (short-subunit alcohol dehydrogenase family)